MKIVVALLFSFLCINANSGPVDVRGRDVSGRGVGRVNENFRRLDNDKQGRNSRSRPWGNIYISTMIPKVSPYADVRAHGALCDGSTDDLAAFDAAIAASDYVYVPRGGCVVSGPIQILRDNVTLFGNGIESKILTNSSTANIIEIGDGSAEIRNTIIADMSFWSTVDKSAGWVIDVSTGSRIKLDGLWIGSQEEVAADGDYLHDGIRFLQFDQSVIDKTIITTDNDCLEVGNGAGMFIGGGSRFVGCSRYGAHVSGNAGGVFFGAVDISVAGNVGVIISTKTYSTNNREIFFGPEFAVDAGGGAGIQVDYGAGGYTEVTGSWIASNDSYGIEVRPNQTTLATLKVVGAQIFNNDDSGIAVSSGQFILDGSHISYNGLVSGGHGVHLAASSVVNAVISDNLFMYNGNSGTGTGYGIRIEAGVTNMNLANNIFWQNRQGQVSNGSGLSASFVIRHNIGYVTETSGTATITTGSSTVTVNHGLAWTPSHVIVSRVSASDGAPAYVTGLTTTQFTINNGAVAGANREFHWQAVWGFRQ